MTVMTDRLRPILAEARTITGEDNPAIVETIRDLEFQLSAVDAATARRRDPRQYVQTMRALRDAGARPVLLARTVGLSRQALNATLNG